MNWLEISVRCGRPAADAVAGLLTERTGGVAIDDPQQVTDLLQRGTWFDYCDLAPGDPNWLTVKGYLPATPGWEDELAQIESGLARLRALGLGAIEPVTTSWVAEQDWAEAWKRYYHPTRVGRRLVVVPSWESYQAGPDDLIITLDPGMAFGTGTHATTRLCLEALEQQVRPGMAVLDIGTGSGILAIAAALLGAAPVWAIDTDAVAVSATRRNAESNGVHGVIAVWHGDLAAWERERAGAGGAAAPRPAGAPPPQLVVANIIADVIIALIPDVARLLPAGGLFVGGGIIDDERSERVQATLREHGLDVLEVRRSEGWVAVVARKGGMP